MIFLRGSATPTKNDKNDKNKTKAKRKKK